MGGASTSTSGLDKEAKIMKKEDLWMMALVAFAVLWTALFGTGLMG
jgi:hypothetical protein